MNQRKLYLLESKLNQIEQKIVQTENRLERAERIALDVSDTMSSLGDAVVTLVQGKNECRQIISEVDDIYQFTRRDGEYVIGKLSQIEATIEEYIAVNMRLDNSLAYNRHSDISVNQMINLNINIAISKSERNEVVINSISDLEPSKQDVNQKEYFDDNGNLYRVGNELVKNGSYQINGYRFETDGQGRTKSASGKLTTVGFHERKMDPKYLIGKGDALDTDDRGHIIGHQFNGPDGMENLIPQDAFINRNDYKLLEENLADQVNDGKDVVVNIIPYYNSESGRPEGIFYFYKINGIAHMVVFPNRKIEA